MPVRIGFGMLWCVLTATNVLVAQETTRVSVDSGGAEGDGASTYGSTSSYGRVIAFSSRAGNLVTGDTNGKSDIFVHDRLSGTTSRVSVTSAGAEANGDSYYCSISADGRYVAFNSYADNLVPADGNFYSDVFVHDRETGVTTRVSVSSAGVEGDGSSFGAAISEDGRFVSFASGSTNLVPGDTNFTGDIFVHDRSTGQTTRVSVSSAGTEANGGSTYPSISGDGRFVAFESRASNLVAGDNNGRHDIFVHDRTTGQTTRVSVDSAGSESNHDSSFASIAGDGSVVAYYSEATNLVAGDTNGLLDVFAHDRATGQTVRASVDSAGVEANGGSLDPEVDSYGRHIVYLSSASNLVPGDTNGAADIFVHDLFTGRTTRVSVHSSGGEGDLSAGYGPSISPDGSYACFSSSARNLVSDDTNGHQDVFVHGADSFVADADSVPVTGGTVNLSLAAGADHAGRTYVIFGSISGTHPGTPLPGGQVTLPVNWDVFSNLVLRNLNTAELSQFRGALNSSGDGTAQLNLPALPPTAVGVRMDFAFALLRPWDFASNPVTVEITP